MSFNNQTVSETFIFLLSSFNPIEPYLDKKCGPFCWPTGLKNYFKRFFHSYVANWLYSFLVGSIWVNSLHFSTFCEEPDPYRNLIILINDI